MKKQILRASLAIMSIMIIFATSSAQEGKVKIKIKTNENGNVTVEEREFDLGEGMDIDQILKDQDIDINMDEMEGKQMIEIIVNGESSSFDLDMDNHAFMWSGPESMMGPHCSKKAFLGVRMDPTYEGKGVKIRGTIEGTAADKMGLQAGDIITAINGNEVSDVESLTEKMQAMEAGEDVQVTYERDGKRMKKKAELGSQQFDMGEHFEFKSDCNSMQFDFDADGFGEKMEEMLKGLEQRFEGMEEGTFDMGMLDEMMEDLQNRLQDADFDFENGIMNSKVIVIIQDIEAEELERVNQNANPQLKLDNDLDLGEFSAFPNPSKGVINLNFEVPEEGDLIVVVYDANGETVYYEMLGDFEGEYSNRVDITKRASGNYFLQVLQNGKTFSRKLIKE